MKKFKKGIAEISGSAAAIGIALFLLAIVAGLSYVVWSNVKKTDEVTTINNLSTEMRGLASSSGYGTSDYSSVLIAAGSVPSNVRNADGKIYNSYGGVIVPQGSGVGYSITDPGLPTKICIGLIAGFNTSDLASTKINNTSFTGEVTADQASTSCSGDTNTVVFTFKS